METKMAAMKTVLMEQIAVLQGTVAEFTREMHQQKQVTQGGGEAAYWPTHTGVLADTHHVGSTAH